MISAGYSHNKSRSGNEATSTIWGEQGNALSTLFHSLAQLQQGKDFYGRNIQNAAQGETAFRDEMATTAANAQRESDNAGNWGNDMQKEIQQQLINGPGRSNTGQMYESIVGGPGNTYIDPMIDAMRRDTAENYRAFQGDNSFDAMMHGASGGSRQAMTDAMMARDMNRDLTSHETQLRQANYDTDLNNKMRIAGIADQTENNQLDRLMNVLNSQQQSRNSAMNLGQFGPFMNDYMNPYNNAQQSLFNPYNNIANAIGSPIMEKRASGFGKASENGANLAIAKFW